MLPEWLNPAWAENSAASMLRGLGGLTSDWGELVATAQMVMGCYQDMPFDQLESLYEEENALSLIAAARIVDTASQSASGLSIENRNELALNAVVAYGMYANFPSACAVAGRLPDSIYEQYQDAWILVSTSAPSMLGDALKSNSLSPLQRQYLESLEQFLTSGNDAHAELCRKLLIDCLLRANTSFEGALYRSCRLCLEHIITLSVAKTLQNIQSKLHPDYISSLTECVNPFETKS